MTTIHSRLPAVAVFILLFSALAALSQDRSTSSFRHFDVVKIDTSRPTLVFRAAGRTVKLSVTPHDLRSAAFRAKNMTSNGEAEVGRASSHTYKGTVVADAGSEVRLTIDGSRVEGFFYTHGDRFFIEPAGRYSTSAAADEMIVYRDADIIKDTSFRCDTAVFERFNRGLDIASRADAASPAKHLRIATDADFEYVNALGSPAAANAEILGILNMAEGVYERELNITLSVVFQHTWSTSDPFAGANTEAAVRNFGVYWNQNFPPSSTPRDAAHLFSAKADLQSQGWAFIGVVCSNPEFAYGMSGYVNWAPAKFLITTHEIAHNLGATHVDAAQSCANTLMNAQLTGQTPMTFCQYSQDEISGYLGANGSCLGSAAGCRFDFDGDSRADLGVFRPATGVWYLSDSTNGFVATQFGVAGDEPVSADYDGDGRSDIAVYRGGAWYRLNSSNGAFDAISFGLPTDIPAPADFDGDGKSDVAVFRPSTGIWYQLRTSGGFAAVAHGTIGDVPVPADYDGDGKADVNVFRPLTGTWYRLNSSTGAFYGIQFGASGDKAVSGDFDGDGKADVTVYRPANGVWYMLFADNSFRATSFGLPADIPAPADFDGDGKSDVSVFRPSTGTWYRLNSSTGAFIAAQFGVSTDLPVTSYYIH